MKKLYLFLSFQILATMIFLVLVRAAEVSISAMDEFTLNISSGSSKADIVKEGEAFLLPVQVSVSDTLIIPLPVVWSLPTFTTINGVDMQNTPTVQGIINTTYDRDGSTRTLLIINNMRFEGPSIINPDSITFTIDKMEVVP